MHLSEVLVRVAAELAMFAGAGFLLFGLNDLAVDLIYFARAGWRSVTVYSRFPRAYASRLPVADDPPLFVIFVPAWEESSVIASMLRASLSRLDYPNYRILVGHYRNDPATAAAIATVADPRVEPVLVDVDGPTTKADCLNHLYDALVAYETATGQGAKGIVLHDSEDLVHPDELKLFAYLIDRAGVIQLPVLPLVDPTSQLVSGHYCDEFAEAHGKDLVVREAIGASIPLAGVGCAISRGALARIAAMHEGRPFADASMTEDYEMGIRIGALGLKTMFVRIRATPGERTIVASRGHFPAQLGAAVRQKARWVGGIALSGWDRLGWRGGWAERWMLLRDRRGPISALLLIATYSAGLLWSQLWLAEVLGAPVQARIGSSLLIVLQINAALLAWRILMRVGFTTSAYGWRQGLLSIPRIVVANLIAVLATVRALSLHLSGRDGKWDKTHHIFPSELAK